MNSDRNLLFGVLAVQMDFVSRDDLIAGMNAWVLDKNKSLGQILLARGALKGDEYTLLEGLVQKHLERHDNDPAKSLAAMTMAEATFDLKKIADADVQQSLQNLTVATDNDPDRTVAIVGRGTSTGTRFRILRNHAEGGLGVVSIAQDEELNREVALKEMKGRYADNPDNRSRFVLEAEITGGLEHPGIVPVYGLGHYADGRPFYAMRFIRGDSLKDAIKRFHQADLHKRDPGQHTLQFRQLLRRFIDVCNAIEYAHSRQVLHRDLKPGNIMLGKYGETFVVDWGLAKPGGLRERPGQTTEPALHPSAQGSSSKTLQGSCMGTPAYMSPEQAEGRLDVLGAPSDVYSLGATLYALLTGKDPIDERDVNVVLKKVRAGEIVKPRERRKEIPAPLESICLRAMALKPADRYASATLLANDIEQWLADEPVSAYRETIGEELARWARRHRNWVTAGLSTVMLVTVVAVVSSVLIDRARQRETLAHRDSETQRALAEKSFLQARQTVDDFFTRVSENKLLDVPGLQPLRKELLESALGYYRDFVKQRAGDPGLRRELAATNYRIGLIVAKLGPKPQAREALSLALGIQEALHNAQPNQPDIAFDLANTFNALGDLDQATGRHSQALIHFEAARKLRENLVRQKPKDAQLRRKLANSFNNIAVVAAKLGKSSQANSEYERANEIRTELAQEHPRDPQFASDLARGFYNVGLYRREHDDLAGSLKSYRRAADLYAELVEGHPKVIDYGRELAITWRVIGDVQGELSKFDAANESYEKARALAEALAKKNPFLIELQADVAAIYMSQGRLRQQTAELAKALERFEQALTIRDRLVADDPSMSRYRQDLAATDLQVGVVLLATGDLDQAGERFEAGLKIYTALAAENGRDLSILDGIAQAYTDLGLVQRRQGKAEAALPLFLKVVELYEKLTRAGLGVDAEVGLADALLNVAVEQRTLTQIDDALRTLERAHEVQSNLVETYPAVAKFRQTEAEIDYLIGLIFLERGQLAEALVRYQRVKTHRARLVADHPENLDNHNLLGVALDEMAVLLWQQEAKQQSLATAHEATGYLERAHQEAPQVVQYRGSLAAHYRNRAFLERESGQLADSARMSLARRKLSPEDGQEQYGVAVELAATVAAAKDAQAKERDEWTREAISALRDAVRLGFRKPEELKADPELAPLAEHPEFKKLAP